MYEARISRMQDSTCWFVVVMIKKTIRQNYNFKKTLPFWCFHTISWIYNFLVNLVLNFLCIDEWQNLRISPINLSKYFCFGFHEFWFIYNFCLPFVRLRWTYVIITYIFNICIWVSNPHHYFLYNFKLLFHFLEIFFPCIIFTFIGFAYDQEGKFMQWVQGIQVT